MSWTKMKLKYLAHMQSGDSITSDSIEAEGIYPVYGGGALRGYTDIYTHDGDYILIGRQGANCGSVREVQGKFFASEHAVVVTHNKKVDNGWLYYLLESMNLNQYSISAAQPGIAVGSIKNLEVNVPLFDLQVKIRKYIDRKTKMFESIIKQKEKLINLLEQQRQSIITEAVTKGLNPNVKMKDSGVEWIDEIPEHWELKQIRRIVKEHRQGFYSEKGYVDEGHKLIRITDLRKDNTIDFEQSPSVELTKIEAANFALLKGDFLFARTGGAGNFGLVDTDLDNVTYASYLIRFRFKGEMITAYLKNFFLSEAFLSGVKTSIHGGVNQNIHAEDIKKQVICIPPKSEQIAIGEKLEEENVKIAKIIKSTLRQIEKLKEYRQALIYEAVTGKIDVREMELD